ncbi:MAG: threonine ammonia-lyase [Natronomonas sp.]
MIELAAIEAARDRIESSVRETPMKYSDSFSTRTGASVYLKLESFQRTGAFKLRGATNRIHTLTDDEREVGVVTASAGNHAQGVALAATQAGVDATIVMPEHAPISKVNATREYGGEVVLYGIDYDEAAERAHDIERSEGRTYLHAFDDPAVIAGQGTIGLEIVDQCPDVDTVVVPIGGGGLISGIATAIKALTDARVIGVQAEGASSVVDSIDAGRIVERDAVDTIADGIATRRVGDIPFEIIQSRVDELVTVTDAEIANALTSVLEREKTLIEGAGAVPMAALLGGHFEYEPDENVVLTLSGGNIDLNILTTVISRGLVERGRFLRIRTVLKDRPGALGELTDLLVAHRTNIHAIEHDRTSKDIAMNAAEVELDLETRGNEHVEELLSALEADGYEVDVLV